ncbi:zinc finger protein 518B [Bufo gargarizans]|uniref:zinc finger protein 518B n=1 Tax=Bufo gargarizans TaxID=30331 RepID=UPI001CF1298A|nr:zinc finger protein 518B [Bufo gargarizans]
MMNNMLPKQMLEKFNCEKCRFSTKDPNKYRNHVSLHNDIKYACSHCDFVSYTKTEFQKHLVTHTGKFPYTCGYCGYGAIRNDYIVKHIRRIHGDGKILCSVSTVENESKKASINITQTHVMAPTVQNILQNSPSSFTEDIIDLTTEVDGLGSSSNNIFPNGNNIAGHVEVEVISPVDQQLNPWIPLTVVAPTSFRVPHNCIAQVVEVKPVNSACHLVLKCLNLVEYGMPNQPVTTEHIYEQKFSVLATSSKNIIENPSKNIIENPSKNIIENPSKNITENPAKNITENPAKNITENPAGPSLQECAVLREVCQENVLCPSNAVCATEENLPTNVTYPKDNTNEIINSINDVVSGMFDDLEEFSGGPIISAVFSLSSDSQNTIEGIQWECPFSSPNTGPSNDADTTPSCLNPPTIQEGPIERGSELKLQQIEMDKSQDLVKDVVMKSEKEPSEIIMEDVKQSTDPEIQLSIKTVPTDVKKTECQPCVFQKSRKSGRISERLVKMEKIDFSKPQTLFLSCDKRIVMQPLSCTMQNNNETLSLMGKVMPQLQVPNKMRRENAKVKLKKVLATTMKARSPPNLRTLRLHPFKVDQATHMPCYNQPVVVLNHPDLESMETSHIMKAIQVFRGKITKITLSQQMLKKYV